MSKRIGWICAIVAIVAYSTNMPIARGAILQGMAPTTLLLGRFLLASALYGVTMGGMVLRAKSTDDLIDGERPLDRFGLSVGLASGFVNGLMMVAFFSALKTVSASISSLMSISLIQIFTLALLAFLGESMTVRKMIQVVIGVSGLGLLVGLGGTADLFGILLIVTGAMLYAGHIISVQWFLRPYNTWTVTSLIVVAATVAVVMLWVITGQSTFIPAPLGWIAIVVQGIVATCIGRILTYKAINLIGSGQFALLTPLETALSVTWAALFLAESLLPVQWLGTVLILFGALLAADLVWHFFERQALWLKGRLALDERERSNGRV